MRKRGGFLLGIALLCGLALTLGVVAVLAQSGAPAINWWVIAGGGGPSSGTGVAVNDTLGQPVIGPSGAAATTLGAGYWYGAVVADDETRCGLAVGMYTFHPTQTVTVTISTLGTLDCLRVQRVDGDHPNATGSAGGSGVGWGRYWTITATDSLGQPASGYIVALALPRNGVADPQVCKYPGGLGGAGWDCARDGYDGDSVWRAGITSLSDWAVGSHTNATPITLRSLGAESVFLEWPWILGGLALLSAASGVLIWWMAPRKARSAEHPDDPVEE